MSLHTSSVCQFTKRKRWVLCNEALTMHTQTLWLQWSTKISHNTYITLLPLMKNTLWKWALRRGQRFLIPSEQQSGSSLCLLSPASKKAAERQWSVKPKECTVTKDGHGETNKQELKNRNCCVLSYLVIFAVNLFHLPQSFIFIGTEVLSSHTGVIYIPPHL